MGYGTQSTDEVEQKSGIGITTSSTMDVGLTDAISSNSSLQQEMPGQSPDEIIRNLEQEVIAALQSGKTTAEAIDVLPPSARGNVGTQVLENATRAAGINPQEHDRQVVEQREQAMQAVTGALTLGTGGLFGLGGDASNKDRAEAYEDLNRIGTISAIGGGTGTVGLAGLTQGQIAILSPGTKMAYASEADLGDLVLQAGTPQAGLAIAQAQKQQVAQETGEYRNRTTR